MGVAIERAQTVDDFHHSARADNDNVPLVASFIGKRTESLKGVRDCVTICHESAYLKPTPSIDESCANALARCQEYADEISRRGVRFPANDVTTQQARNLALTAIDELEIGLRDARPSDMATHLGLGW